MTAAAITKSDVRATSLSAGTELDQLCINTIRTLAMDAVQQAKSGHPGTPMALAPLAYVIWQHFLRFDSEDPIWPNRDRFVLSNGHASMLLYAILHLSGVKAVNAKYERLGEASSLTRRHQTISAAREQMSRPPGISPDLGGRNNDGSSRPGLRQQRRHGISRAVASASFQPAGFHDL